MSNDSLRRVEALLNVTLGVVTNARSGRVALAQLATALDPAWIPQPQGAAFLARLRDASEAARRPLDAGTVTRVLRSAWDADPLDELDELEPEPIAVTPAAQVHRGRLDGAPVAIKVLRPGLAAAVHQDVALIDTLAAPLSAAFPELNAADVLAEVRERVLDELDLEHEAMVQRRVHRALRRHPFLSVPAPVTRLCHDEVLVSEWVDGVPFDRAPDPDAAAARLVAFAMGAARWGLAYVDFEPANVIVTADGTLAIVDFGACRELDRERARLAAGVLEALASDDGEGFAAGVEALGWLPRSSAPAARSLAQELLAEHLEPGPTRLDTAAVRATRDRLFARAGAAVEVAAIGALAPEDLWPARGVGQALGTIARLGATGDWVALALEAFSDGWG